MSEQTPPQRSEGPTSEGEERKPSTPAGAASPRWLDPGTLMGLALPALVTALLIESYIAYFRDSYFTGGFLTHYYCRTTGDVVTYFAASVAVDLSLYGSAALILAGLMKGVRRLTPRGLLIMGFVLGLVPVFYGTILFEILAYVKDPAKIFHTGTNAGDWWTSLMAVKDEILTALGKVALHVLIYALVWFAISYLRSKLRRAGEVVRRPLVGRLLVIVLLLVPGVSLVFQPSPLLAEGLERKLSFKLIQGGLNQLSDYDGDSFGLLKAPRDHAPCDYTRYPCAVEVRGDGIDQNGIGGDLAPEPVGALETAAFAREVIDPKLPTSGRKRHVVLIALESVRYDVIGRRHKEQDVMPFLTGLAEQGASAKYAYSHRGYTLPSIYTMLTGRHEPLDVESTIFDDLNTLGYHTAAYSCSDWRYGDVKTLTHMVAANRYFDAQDARDERIYDGDDPTHLLISEKVLNREIGTMLATRPKDDPLFLFINYESTHYAYDSPQLEDIIAPRLAYWEISRENKDRVVEGYLNAAANVDRALGVLFELLKTHGILQDALVIITSDHGESLYDGDFLGHGHRLINEEMHIPFIVLNPGRGVPLEEPLGLVDVRKLIHDHLAADPDPAGRFKTRDDLHVFQHVGTLRDPLEIGWVNTKERLNIDLQQRVFRRMAHDAETPTRWQPLPATLPADAVELVHTWERYQGKYFGDHDAPAETPSN